jgi:hypothetical protein
MPPAAPVSYEQMMLRLNALATARGEWCGTPMPLPGLGLVLEDKHPFAAEVSKAQAIVDRDADGHVPEFLRACRTDDQGWRLVNEWHGSLRNGTRGTIAIARHEDGRTTWFFEPDAIKRNQFIFGPFATMDAWSLDTELTAIDKLATLLSERMFKSYILTGCFLETSKRSGLTYWFRRLRPTIVLSSHGSRRDGMNGVVGDDEVRLLCTLCLHPLAYYRGTFCGAMTPTDDVICHLLLMRGDEPLYWRRANQHTAGSPESGI